MESEPSTLGLHAIIAFGVCLSFMAIIFGTMIWQDAQEMRRLKKRNAEIRQQYDEVRAAMYREMERRVAAEQLSTTGTPVLSAAMSGGIAPLRVTTTSTANPAITVTANLQTRSAPYTPRPGQESAESHFERISLPRRFIRLD